jgi:hypothetical protein
MPRATKVEKLDKVFNWLNKEFPVKRKSYITLKDIDKDFQGYVVEDSYSIEVVICRKLPFYSSCDTLIHEWAHVKSRRVGHGIKFLQWYHRIDDSFWKWRKTEE